MGRAPCCDKANVKRGTWSAEEDTALKNYIQRYGTGGNWIALPHKAGLRRCGKSCRLRWLNYLRPDIKHGGFTEQEDNIICTLYKCKGSRWSVIASHLTGRTDNDVKNYWNTKLKKKMLAAQANLTDNINTATAVTTAAPSTPPAIPIPKTEPYGYNTFSLPTTDAGDLRLTAQNPNNFDMPSTFLWSSKGYAVSPAQGGCTSASSSSLTMENNNNSGYMSWPEIGGITTGGDVQSDGLFYMDMVHGTPLDFFNWCNFNDTSNLWDSVDSKPHGMNQSVTYI